MVPYAKSFEIIHLRNKKECVVSIRYPFYSLKMALIVVNKLPKILVFKSNLKNIDMTLPN